MKPLLILAELASMLPGFKNEIIIGCGEEQYRLVCLVLSGGPLGPADCWSWFVLALTLQGQQVNPTLQKEDKPSSANLQLSWDPR